MGFGEMSVPWHMPLDELVDSAVRTPYCRGCSQAGHTERAPVIKAGKVLLASSGIAWMAHAATGLLCSYCFPGTSACNCPMSRFQRQFPAQVSSPCFCGVVRLLSRPLDRDMPGHGSIRRRRRDLRPSWAVIGREAITAAGHPCHSHPKLQGLFSLHHGQQPQACHGRFS